MVKDWEMELQSRSWELAYRGWDEGRQVLCCLAWCCSALDGCVWEQGLFFASPPICLLLFSLSTKKEHLWVKVCLRRNVHTVLCVVCVHMNNSGMMLLLMPVWNFIFKLFHTICSFKTHEYARRVFHNLFKKNWSVVHAKLNKYVYVIICNNMWVAYK